MDDQELSTIEQRHGFLHLGAGYWQRIDLIAAVCPLPDHETRGRELGYQSVVYAVGTGPMEGGRFCTLSVDALMALVAGARAQP